MSLARKVGAVMCCSEAVALPSVQGGRAPGAMRNCDTRRPRGWGDSPVTHPARLKEELDCERLDADLAIQRGRACAQRHVADVALVSPEAQTHAKSVSWDRRPSIRGAKQGGGV